MEIKKEREAFEAFFYENCLSQWEQDMSEMLFQELENGEYDYARVQSSWLSWQAAKAQAVPEKDAVIKKLSDQLYAQEMKASAARVLCETACELLDDYAHQDAMVILNDLEQAMKEPAND